VAETLSVPPTLLSTDLSRTKRVLGWPNGVRTSDVSNLVHPIVVGSVERSAEAAKTRIMDVIRMDSPFPAVISNSRAAKRSYEPHARLLWMSRLRVQFGHNSNRFRTSRESSWAV